MSRCNEIRPSLRSIKFRPNLLTFATDWHGHLNFAAWIVETAAPRKIVELGVFRGDSLATFAQASQENMLRSDIFGVDTWQGDKTTGTYSEETYLQVKDYFLLNHPRVVLSRMTFDQARLEHEVGTVDLLHIDGCHGYDEVKHDFETWLSRISDSGIVLFHDISVSNIDFGTAKYWSEIRELYPSFSFHHSNGLGVLLVGQNQNKDLMHLSSCKDCLEYFQSINEVLSLMHSYNDKYRWVQREKDALYYENEKFKALLTELSPSPNQNILKRLLKK